VALLWMDSFDFYATADVAARYVTAGSSVNIYAGSGRRGSAALNLGATNAVYRSSLPVSGTTCIAGAAFKTPEASPNYPFFKVMQGGTVQCSLDLVGGLLRFWRGDQGTLLGTAASGALLINTYYYVEMKVVVDPSAGSVVLRVNNVVVLSLSSVNTAASGSAGWTALALYGPSFTGPYVYFDDFYLLDGSGSAPWNDVLGDCRVDVRYPTAAGATTGWTPSTGSNWQNVDDAAPNGDTDYNSATGVATDTFTVQDAPVVGATIYGVQQNLSVKKSDPGFCTVAPVIRHSGVDYVGTDYSPPTSYVFATQTRQTNPGTSAQWTEAGFNAAEFGYKRTT